jgi:uncharacterized damage-inducible protein DinB
MTMTEHTLPLPDGYDPARQAEVGLLAAALDDQLRRLRDSVAGLITQHLEWQERPGRNTVGMLLAHIAAVEIGWLQVGCAGLSYEQDSRRVIQEHLGIEDDGLPLPPGGTHPKCLAGRSLADYIAILDRARAATHLMVRDWTDESLSDAFSADGHSFSHRWVLYHLLEHLAAHHGQIGSLLHAMRDHDLPHLPDPGR